MYMENKKRHMAVRKEVSAEAIAAQLGQNSDRMTDVWLGGRKSDFFVEILTSLYVIILPLFPPPLPQVKKNPTGQEREENFPLYRKFLGCPPTPALPLREKKKVKEDEGVKVSFFPP